MNLKDDISLYLPKYLSTESANALIDALKDFPDVSPTKFYTSRLFEEQTIFQGDGLTELIFVNLPSVDLKYRPGIVLSNTCDISSGNRREVATKCVYSPIYELAKFEQWLIQQGKSQSFIRSYFENIRKQYNTTIFYLPELPGVIKESLVFLDNLFNVPADFLNPETFNGRKLFTLSNYGHYLLLFKLSFHFSRLQEKVDRDAGRVL